MPHEQRSARSPRWSSPTDMRNVRISLAGALALSFSGYVAAAQAACDSSAHRQFDFWLGNWEIRTPDGKLAGINSIERKHEGCVLHERYSSKRDYSGESLNIYDVSRGVWHQTWVDSSGLLLLLEGGVRNGKMVLEGVILDAEGNETKHRITWAPNADGSVRQLWESTDADGRWQTAFDGIYTRR